jgi:hypothetical protein
MIMRYSFLIFGLISFIFFSCNTEDSSEKSLSPELVQNPITADGKSDLSKLPVITFEKVEHDFGAIIQGEKVSYTFKFKNTGGSDLLVTSAKGSCGCTVPKFSKEPIAPGKSGEMEIIFDSSGKSGIQNKTITVLSNSQPNTVVLTVSADVVVPK